MVSYCLVPNCRNSRRNSNRNVTYHRFPLLRPYVLKFWLRAIPQEDFKPSPHHVLCSDHFLPECFLPGVSSSRPRRQLKKSAIPTLFDHAQSEMVSEDFGNESEESSSRVEQQEVTEDILDDTTELLRMRVSSHCRLCADVSQELVPVFGEVALGLQLLEKIHTYLPIMVTEEDLLPISVCVSCLNQLELCHQFISGCVEADSKLKRMLGFETDGDMVEANMDCTESDSIHAIKNEPAEVTEQLNSIESPQFESDNVELVKEVDHYQEDIPQLDGLQEVEEADDSQTNYDAEQMPRNGDGSCEAVPLSSHAPVKKLKKHKEKPKFRVVILKMKNAANMTTDSPEFRKALDRAMRSKKCNQISSRKHEEDLQPSPLKHESKSSGTEDIHYENELSAINQSEPANQPATEIRYRSEEYYFEEVTDDHTYTNINQSLVSCKYCKKILPTREHLLSHIASAHQDKVFVCADCKIVFHSSKLLEAHLKRHVNSLKCSNITSVEDKLSLMPVVHLERLETFVSADTTTSFNNAEKTELKVESNFYDSDANTDLEEESEVYSTFENIERETENMKQDLQAGQNESSCGSPFVGIPEHAEHNDVADGDVEDDVKVVDVHIKTELSSEEDELDNNSKVFLKLSKEFENIDNDYKRKIIKSINRIIENNGEIIKAEPDSEEFASKISVQSESNKHHWQCYHCNHISTTRKEYREHKRMHPHELYTCESCGKKYTSQQYLERHICPQSDEKRFVCEYCGKDFRYWLSLKNHLPIHEKDGKLLLKCEECDKEFSSRMSYRSHVTRHAEPSYLCEVCGKKMKYLTSLRWHRRIHQDPNSVLSHCCAVCGKRYRSRIALEDHTRVHTNEKPFECIHCGKRFHTHHLLLTHKIIHINARQHKCPVCGKGFNRSQHLKNHLRTHAKRMHTCKFCHKIFPNIGELVMHRRTHTQEEIANAIKFQKLEGGAPIAFLCQICGKQLSNKVTLKNHVMLHTDDKPYSCEVCGKKFAMNTTLRSHQLLHTGEKPFPCHYCSMSFRFKQTLIIHERIHTGETPYKCPKCDKKFRSRQSLQQHVLLHSEEKPHKCPHCDKRFRRPDIRNVHVRTHTGERPYPCAICGQRFKQMGDRNKHQQKHVPKNIASHVEITATMQ